MSIFFCTRGVCTLRQPVTTLAQCCNNVARSQTWHNVGRYATIVPGLAKLEKFQSVREWAEVTLFQTLCYYITTIPECSRLARYALGADQLCKDCEKKNACSIVYSM